jgi:hypothetical protein
LILLLGAALQTLCNWRTKRTGLSIGLSPKVAGLRRVESVSVIFQHDPDDTFAALTEKASLAEGKSEIRRHRKASFDAYLPDGSDRWNAKFVTIDVARVELWIRGVAPSFAVDHPFHFFIATRLNSIQ